jgi:hypothetical protein
MARIGAALLVAVDPIELRRLHNDPSEAQARRTRLGSTGGARARAAVCLA